MAVSSLKLTPKGHLTPTMFNRATVLRHTHTEIPRGDCASCSRSILTTIPARSVLQTQDHQCLFCAECLQRAADKVDVQRVSSSQEILGRSLTTRIRDAEAELEKTQEQKTAILCESLTELDRKPLFCGFCRKVSSGLPVRYCVQCQKYLCSGCYARHQGEVKMSKKWMFRRHATIDLTKIRNPDVL